MPYLSIIAVEHDAASARRFADALAAQARRHNLAYEVILCSRTERNSAIRRAVGEFILCTTTSIAFSDALVEFLASGRLQPNRLYRINRHDLDASGRMVRTWTPHGIFTDPPTAVPVDGRIQFGEGWFEYERDSSGRFWWIEDYAGLTLDLPTGGGILRMEIEPGPCAGNPQPLQVLDDAGTKVAEWLIRGRDTFLLHIPPSVRGIRLRVPCGVPPLPHDPRALRFRVLSCEWYDPSAAPLPWSSVLAAERHTLARLLRSGGLVSLSKALRLLRSRRRDVFDSVAECEIGAGWHKLETEHGATFRWVNTTAELGFFIADGSTHLALLLEPGPSVRFQPFELVVEGDIAARRRVAGLTYMELPLSMRQAGRAHISLNVEGAAAGALDDPRILAYRVFACGRGTARDTRLRADPSGDAWSVYTVHSRPAEEFLYPDPLHLFSCGDFQLMARDHWLDLRGYAEFDEPSAHVDALLSHAARQLGIQQELLTGSLCIHHIEPDHGETETPRTDYLTLADRGDLTAETATLQAPLIFNRETWVSPSRAAVPVSEPYISVVVAARNDNHGGNMLARMQAFLDSWLGLARRYNLPSEMIIVEWNPPADRRPLREELHWIENANPCHVRFIEVPREFHASFPNHATVLFHQMIAKNVGIRRARGQFILATNLDIVFSPELMEFLSTRQLDPSAMYRMDRYDVASQLPPGTTLDELIEFCRTHVIRVIAREGAYDSNGANTRPVEADDIVPAGSGLRLGPGWHGIERFRDAPPMRYFDAGAQVRFDRPSGDAREILIDAEIGPSAPAGGLELEVLDATGVLVTSATLRGRHQLRLTLPQDVHAGHFGVRAGPGGVPLLQDLRFLDVRVFSLAWCPPSGTSGWKLETIASAPMQDWTDGTITPSPFTARMRDPQYLHANACGDFTMLSREAWFTLRGYPEFPIWPTHLDSILCYSAHHAGFREVVLSDPLRIFHIDHPAIWTPGAEEERAVRAAKLGITMVRYASLVKYGHYMRRFNAPMIFTARNWGLADKALPENGPPDDMLS